MTQLKERIREVIEPVIISRKRATTLDCAILSRDLATLIATSQEVQQAFLERVGIDEESVKCIVFENIYQKPPLYLTIGTATEVQEKISKALSTAKSKILKINGVGNGT